MRKVISMIVAIAMLVTMFSTVVNLGTASAATQGFTVSVDSVSGKNGTEVVVPINFENVPSDGISTADMTITYDSTKLEYVSLDAGSIVTNPSVNFASNKESDGKLKLLFLDYTMSTGYISQDGSFAKITFKVKTSDVTSTKVSITKSTFGDKSLAQLNPTVNDGTVTLNGGAASTSAPSIAPTSTVGVPNNPSGKFTVNVASVSGKNGEEIEVPVKFSGVPSNGISTTDMTITYDSTKLEYVSASAGSIVTNPSVNFGSNKESDGKIKLLFLDYTMDNGYISQDGVFVNLTFKVKTSSATTTEVSIAKSTYGDKNLSEVSATVNAGTITLNGSTDVPSSTPAKTATPTVVVTSTKTAAPTAATTATKTTAPTGFTAYVDSVSGNAGDTIVVPVKFVNVPSSGIITTNMTISYDASKLEYVSGEAGDIVTDPTNNFGINKETDGKIKTLFLDLTMTNGYISKDGVYANLTFKVKASTPVSTSVSLSDATFGDKDLSPITAKLTSGIIALNGGGAVVTPDTSATAKPSSFTVYVDKASGNMGDEIVVPVSLVNIPSGGITTTDMAIIYDASKLEYVSGEAGDIVTDPSTNFGINKESDGKIKMLFLDYTMTNGAITQDGVFAKITFKVKTSSAVSTVVSIVNPTFGDKDLATISVKATSGTIALNGGGAVVTPNATAKPSNFTIYVDAASGNNGEQIVVPVKFVNVPSIGVSAIDAAVVYDASKLEYVSGAPGSIVTDPSTNFGVNKQTDGKIKLLFLDYTMSTGAITQDGVFADLTFKVKTSSAVNTNISLFDVTVGDKNLASLDAKLGSGTIALNGGGTTPVYTPIVATEFTAAIGTVEANTGDQIEVPVQIAKVPSSGITTADMTITYDASKLEYVSGGPGDIVTDPSTNFGINKQSDGTIKLLFLDYTMISGAITQDGVFASLVFKVKATEKTSTNITITKATFGDVKLNPISAKLVSGGVSINGGGGVPQNTTSPVVTTQPTPTTTTKPVVSSNLKVEFFNNGVTQAQSNSIYPKFRLTNTGSTPINLSDVKLRYYFTVDGDKTQSFWCDWSPVGSSNVSGTFVKLPTPVTGADQYLEVSFNSVAGALAANTSIEVQCRFAKSDWSNYNQADDYSLCSSSNFTTWDKVTAYISGNLVWGIEPTGSGVIVTEAPKTSTPTKTATPTNTVKTPTPTATTVDPNALKVEIGTVSGNPGDTVVVPVNISKISSKGVSAADMTIEYDASVLEYVSGEAGDIVTDPSTNFGINKQSDGIIKVLFLDYTMDSGYISKDGVFVNLTFKIKSTAKAGTTSDIKITKSTFGDKDLGTLSAAITAGKVEVIDGTAMKVVIGNVTGEAGKEVVVPITIEGISANGVATADMTVEYDADKLEYVDGAPGSIVTNPDVNFGINKAADGKIKLLFLDYTMDNGAITKDGVFVNLTFKIKSGLADGTVASVTKTTATFGDKDLATLNVVITNGSVKVGKTTATPTTTTSVVTPTPTTTNTTVTSTPATADGTKVVIGNVTGEAGKEVVVPITIEGIPASGVATADMTVEYDADKLEYVSGAPGSIVTNPDVNFGINKAADGKIKLLFLDYTMDKGYISEDGVFVNLTFKIKSGLADGTVASVTKTTATFGDKDLATLDVVITNGSVTVGKVTVTPTPTTTNTTVTSTPATADGTKVVIGNVTGEAGKEVVVPITIEGIPASGVATADMTVEYDADKLEYVSGAPGSIVTNPDVNFGINKAADGKIKLLFLDYTMDKGYISEDGVFVNLTFKIKSGLADGTVASVTKTTATFGDKDLATLDVVITNGSVTVGKVTVTSTPTTAVVTPTPTTTNTTVTSTPTATTPAPTGFILEIGNVGVTTAINKGDKVVVPVKIKNVPEKGVSSVSMTIFYDADKLEYVSGAAGSIVTNPDVNFGINKPADGKIKVLFLDYTMESQYISEDGTFIELTFNVIGEDGFAEIKASDVTFADNTLDSINTTIIDGGVFIGGEGTVESYTISGYISPDFITTATTAPIVNAGFKVELVGTNDSAITDSNGYFEIKTTAAKGKYTVKITKDNYLTRQIADVEIDGDKELSTSASPISMWAGDMVINGKQDGAINLEDIVEICKAFNTASTDEKYKENLDLNKDGAVNLEDVVIVAKHFNKVSSNY
jgi:hypothetical protein